MVDNSQAIFLLLSIFPWGCMRCYGKFYAILWSLIFALIFIHFLKFSSFKIWSEENFQSMWYPRLCKQVQTATDANHQCPTNQDKDAWLSIQKALRLELVFTCTCVLHLYFCQSSSGWPLAAPEGSFCAGVTFRQMEKVVFAKCREVWKI